MKSPLFFVQTFVRWMGFGGSGQASGEQLSGPMQPPSGVPGTVTEDSALAVSAVFGCIRILAETVAGIPICTYVLRKGQWLEDTTDELYSLLQLRPNPHMTHIDFWESVLFNLIFRGNGYAYVVRNSLGMPIALYPMAAQQVQPVVMRDGTGWYVYTYDGEQMLYGEEDVLHFRIFGNGRIGLSPLQYGARTMGIAAAADKYSGEFFNRGGKPGGVLRIDRILNSKQREELRTNFKDVHEGTDNAHKLFVLEAGMQYQQVQLKPEDVQMIETRRFSTKDIARFFGVPAFLLNESEGSTSWGTGLEQQMLGFYALTINPYCRRIAATLRVKLIPLAEQRRRKVEYDYDELLAVDLRAKAEYYSKLGTGGIMTRNEIRAKLRLPASTQKYADALTVQGAMLPLEKMGEKPPASTPKETDDTEPEGNQNAD